MKNLLHLSSIFLCITLIYISHLSAMAENKLKINFCDTVDLLALQDVGKKTAKAIAKFRERSDNLTMETLEFVPKLRVSKRLYDAIDFTPNPQYDYSTSDEGIEDLRQPGKKQREPDTDVIGRLTQVISSRETTPKFHDHHEPQAVFRGALPKGRPDSSFPEKSTRESGWGSRTRKVQPKTRAPAYMVESIIDDSEEEDFYDSLRELPYSRRPSVSKFRPTSMPKALCYDGKTIGTILRGNSCNMLSHVSYHGKIVRMCCAGVSQARRQTITP